MTGLVLHVQITPKMTNGNAQPDQLAPVDRRTFVAASAPASEAP
jgi:hypothetical protein